MNKGEYDKSIEYFEKALLVLKSKLGPNHPWTLQVRGNLDKAKEKQTESAK